MGQEVTGRLPNGQPFPFLVHESGDQHVSRLIAETGRWEPFTTKILWSILQPGDGVLDIGANIGWYSAVLGRAVGRRGYVHAFEPDPINAKLLRRNVDVDSLRHVRAHEIGLADQVGSMDLTISTANLGDHRLSSGFATDRATQKVPVDRLDDVLAREGVDLDRLRVIKIDTQGAENMIVRGAPKLFTSLPARTAVLIEFAPNLLAAHGPSEVDAFIRFVTGLGRPLWTLRRASIAATDGDRLRRLATKLQPLGDEWAVDVLIAPDSAVDQRKLHRFRVPRPVRWV
jgi:FkbM family methyltransferase